MQGLSGNRTDDFSTPVSSGSNMSSIARFPKLDECAHFHYEHVELGNLEVRQIEDTEGIRLKSFSVCVSFRCRSTKVPTTRRVTSFE